MKVLKICRKCEKAQEESEFFTRTNGRLETVCKTCKNLNAITWYSKNREKCRKRCAINQANNRERYNKYNASWARRNREYVMWKSSKRSAKKYNVPHTITKEDIIIPGICPVLGIPIVSGTEKSKNRDNSPSLDRIIPRLGYVKENIQVISDKANRGKNNLTLYELILMGKWAQAQFDTPKEDLANYVLNGSLTSPIGPIYGALDGIAPIISLGDN